jgi:hypothetical protein
MVLLEQSLYRKSDPQDVKIDYRPKTTSGDGHVLAGLVHDDPELERLKPTLYHNGQHGCCLLDEDGDNIVTDSIRGDIFMLTSGAHIDETEERTFKWSRENETFALNGSSFRRRLSACELIKIDDQ